MLDEENAAAPPARPTDPEVLRSLLIEALGGVIETKAKAKTAEPDRPRFDESKYYSTRELEDSSRVPGHQFRRMIREGKLPAKRLPGGRSYFVRGDHANNLFAD